MKLFQLKCLLSCFVTNHFHWTLGDTLFLYYETSIDERVPKLLSFKILSYGTFSPTRLLNYCCFMIAMYVIIIGQ